MLNNMPDWIPFACLMTGRMVRKPMFTRVIEGLIQATVAAGFTLYVGVQILQRDFIYEKEKLQVHMAMAEKRTAQRDIELREARFEVHRINDDIVRRLERIEECIRVRTCTK